MARITDYASLASPQAADVLPVVDVSDTSTSAAGTTKQVTVGSLLAGMAPLASPALTGAPTAPTASALTASVQVATTAYADSATGVEKARALAAEALLAPLASPALTGAPTAPTASALTSSTRVATTAYADSATGTEKARALAAEALLAPLASPALTGTPTAATASPGTGSTRIATTAYADAAVAVETSRAETAEALALPKAGGTLTGPLIPRVTALTDGASILVSAAAGNDFAVTIAGNRTMAVPSSPSNGQCITFAITQDATGSRTLAWASGAGGYSFGSGSAPTLSTAAGATDLIAFRYAPAAGGGSGAWCCLGSGLGY